MQQMMNCALEIREQAPKGAEVGTHDLLVPGEPWQLDAILKDLFICFNKKDISRALLQAVGSVIIQELAEAPEVNDRLAQWQERWRETVRMEAQPMGQYGQFLPARYAAIEGDPNAWAERRGGAGVTPCRSCRTLRRNPARCITVPTQECMRGEAAAQC